MMNMRLKKIVAGILIVGMILGFTPVTKTDVFAEHETESFYPSDYTTSEEKSFEDFIERLYTIALNRDSDAEGKAFWIKRVTKEGATGADCARFFLLDAPEFMNRNLSVDTFVETLYKTFFDRKSDAAGKKGWVDAINSKKMTRSDVVNNFIESTEWCNVCAGYGVKSGAQFHKATVASKNATEFATRLYTCCLKRDPEDAGLKYWSLALTNLEQTGCTAAQNFFESKEFIGFKTDDKEYLTRLYTTFMGREPEDAGLNYWLGELKKSDRTTIMARFAECQEFTDICLKYGIDKGKIIVPPKASYGAKTFVINVFASTLRRDPSEKEISDYGAQLTSGELTACGFIDQIFRSSEYNVYSRPLETFIEEMYLLFLRQDGAGSSNMVKWTRKIRSGESSRYKMMCTLSQDQKFTSRCSELKISKGTFDPNADPRPVEPTPTPKITSPELTDKSKIPGTDESYAVIRQAIKDAMIAECSWHEGWHFSNKLTQNQQMRAEYTIKHNIFGHVEVPGTFIPLEAASGLTCFCTYDRNDKLIRVRWAWYDHSGTEHDYDNPYDCFYDVTVFDIVEHTEKISKDPESTYLGYGVYGMENACFPDKEWRRDWDFNLYVAGETELGAIIWDLD